MAAAWHRAELGKEVREDHVTFADWDAFASVMTGKRFELLRHLRRNPAASVAARALGRDYKRVHEDVDALAAIGLVEREGTGVRADYDEIRTVIAL